MKYLFKDKKERFEGIKETLGVEREIFKTQWPRV
jgi:hypothetical protein